MRVGAADDSAAQQWRLNMADEGLKLSARNQLLGVITAIQKNDIVAQVELRVGDNHVVAVITASAVDDLGLQVGEEATA